jgi:hypothetical protein
MFWNGARIGLPTITPNTILPSVDPQGPEAGAGRVYRGVAVGTASRGACGLPFATGSLPAAAAPTLASGARVQVPAGDERSKTWRSPSAG